MKNNTDLRVIKTHKALTSTLLECLKEKPFDELTIQYICDKAMVRRSTFYSHFEDKYDLFAFTVREVYSDFPSFKSLNRDTDLKDVSNFLVEDIFDFLLDNIKIVDLMKENQTNMILLDIISSELIKAFMPLLEKEKNISNIISPDLVMNFYVKGIFGAVLWWTKEKQPITKEELIKQIGLLVKSNLQILE